MKRAKRRTPQLTGRGDPTLYSVNQVAKHTIRAPVQRFLCCAPFSTQLPREREVYRAYHTTNACPVSNSRHVVGWLDLQIRRSQPTFPFPSPDFFSHRSNIFHTSN